MAVDGEGTPDYCLSGTLPPEVQRLLGQFRPLHIAVAQLLGAGAADFYRGRITVIIDPNPLGPIDSYGYSLINQNIILLGVWPDWKTRLIDRSIYVHELGHILPQIANPKYLPRVLLQQQNSPLLFEGFPDWLAIAITGGISDKERFPLSSCMLNYREIRPGASFGDSSTYFKKGYALGRLQECCNSLAGKTELEAGACKRVGEDTLGQIPKIEVSPFSPERFGEYDLHMIGVPWNSFYMEVNERTQGSGVNLFLRSFAEAANVSEAHRCYVNGQADSEISVHAIATGDIFSAMRKRMIAGGDGDVFEEAYREHAFDRESPLEKRPELAEAGRLELVAAMEEERSSMLNTGNPCYPSLKFGSADADPSCIVKCD